MGRFCYNKTSDTAQKSGSPAEAGANNQTERSLQMKSANQAVTLAEAEGA
jgi:hypothetical protein